VVLDLTPEQWVGCLNKEGEYLPACCGNISRVRDILFGVIREEFYIDVEPLWEASYLLRHHHDEPNEVQQKIIDLWEAVKKDADVRVRAYGKDLDHLEDAVEVIASGVNYLAWDHIGKKDQKQLYQKDVNWYWQFYKMLPAFRKVYKSMQDNDIWQPKQGWAVVEQGLVLEFTFGLAIFEKKKDADDIVAEIMQYHPVRHDRNLKMDVERKFDVRPVELTIEKGLVFLDTDGGPEGYDAVKPLEKVTFVEE
jgi:hypothetical protein